MNLREYLEHTKIPKKAFAMKAKLCEGIMRKVYKGQGILFTTAMKICEASEGEVDPYDLYYELLAINRKNSKNKQASGNKKTINK